MIKKLNEREATSKEKTKVMEVFEGIPLPVAFFSKENLHFASKFQFQDTDILLLSYPKSGTHWMQQILSLMLNKEDLQNQNNIPTFIRVPWIENFIFQKEWTKIPEPRLLTTHLPANFFIKNLKNSKVRVVFLVRNPKDVLVSFYHFYNFSKFLPDFNSFDDFFHQFIEGKVSYGSWFNHTKSWLGVWHELNSFLITYEDLSQKPHQVIQNLANFLGQKLEPDDMENILHYSSFSSMSQNDSLNYSSSIDLFDHSKGKFFRKGVTGNWKEHFSPEQNDKFNNIYQEKLGDLTFKFDWSLN
ncbi:sulfotransferase 2A1-like isoform X3 [Monodelphis domestica]|uniref:sulfotransferase 2A1-like isoform X3 n=1 Tax=Monodelphis domestica TaxID=13616 RepID=UPI0024E268E5|nr:sulfotransferase 2A1-like isoform X3 [Monodelphis domestica]